MPRSNGSCLIDNDYLAWTERNLRERLDFFKNLNASEISEQLANIGRKRKVIKERSRAVSKVPRRKCSRFYRKVNSVSYGREKLFDRLFCDGLKDRTTVDRDASILDKLKDCCYQNQQAKKSGLNFDYDRVPVICNIRSAIAKTKPSALAIHPGELKILCAVGTSSGAISLFLPGIEGTRSFQKFQTHESLVTGVHFGQTDVLSISNDGSMQRLELNKAELGFMSINQLPAENGSYRALTCLSEDEFWLACNNGILQQIDPRSQYKGNAYYNVSQGQLNSISSFASKHLLCTAVAHHFDQDQVNRHAILLHDSRFMKKPIITVPQASVPLMVSFNQHNCKAVMVASEDSYVRVYCYKESRLRLKLTESIPDLPCSHMPIWLPRTNANFIVGAEKKRLMLYSAENHVSLSNFNCLNLLPDDNNASSRTNLLVAHETLPIIVGVSRRFGSISLFNFNG